MVHDLHRETIPFSCQRPKQLASQVWYSHADQPRDSEAYRVSLLKTVLHFSRVIDIPVITR